MATVNLDTTSNSLASVADSDVVNWTSSSQAITASVDQSGLANGLTSFHIGPTVTHDLGTAGTPAKFDVDVGSTPYFRNAGQGVVYYTPDGNSNVCAHFYQAGTGRLEAVGSTGTFTTLSVSKGTANIADGVGVTTLFQSGGTSNLIWTSAGATVTTATVVGGSCQIARQITTLNVGGNGSAIIDADTRAIATVNLFGGRLGIAESGTITAFNYYGGEFDLSLVSRPITITTLTIASNVKYFAQFLTHPLITITNPVVYLGDRVS